MSEYSDDFLAGMARAKEVQDMAAEFPEPVKRCPCGRVDSLESENADLQARLDKANGDYEKLPNEQGDWRRLRV
jgi:hypothetical protein